MQARSGSPRPPIAPRDERFELEPARIADWCAGDRAVSAYFNALSLLFPAGERFFIASVAAFGDRIDDPALRESVRGFTAQEAMHTREHLLYDRLLAGLVDVDELESAVADHFAWLKSNFPPVVWLSATAALEHLTAIMAHEVLGNPAHLEGALPSYRRLWTWHALEEAEHKSVAFDVFQAVAGRRQYFLRVHSMLVGTALFFRYLGRNLTALLRAQGLLGSPRAWGRLAWYLCGRPGMFRRILVPYLRYYLPGFHPNDVDEGPLLDHARLALETQA